MKLKDLNLETEILGIFKKVEDELLATADLNKSQKMSVAFSLGQELYNKQRELERTGQYTRQILTAQFKLGRDYIKRHVIPKIEESK